MSAFGSRCWNLRRVLPNRRGDKRTNLTNLVSRQLDLASLPPSSTTSLTGGKKHHGEAVIGKKGRPVESLDAAAVRRASTKLQDGDIRGAVRALYSEESLAPLTEDTLMSLRIKHPAAPVDRRPPPFPSTAPLQVTSSDVLSAIKSFSPGSAGGRDGLRPQHLRDIVIQPGGTGVCDALRDFCNLVLAGGVPDVVRPVFFGATLFPFLKKWEMGASDL